MTKETTPKPEPKESPIPIGVLVVFRGIGQVFFQDNALSGLLFVIGIAFSVPLMAAGAVIGSAIGTIAAWAGKYDKDEWTAGIYGFNSTLVGIATFFFFEPTTTSLVLMVIGCIVSTELTRLMRTRVPFPTYTTPFIITTWVVFFVGLKMDVPRFDPSAPPFIKNLEVHYVVESTMHGIGQVMFQGSIWTGLLFFIGIAINSREHAGWVLAGSIVGMLIASHHTTATVKAVNPETLADSTIFDNIKLGLYGYNATLAPVALYLWRRSFVAPILAMLLTEPLTELVPLMGVPALTAPFVLAAWIVLGLHWLEGKLLGKATAPAK